jgi:HSP20 family protein
MMYTNLPTLPVFGLRREIDRVFDDVFGRDNGATARWLPAADVREDEKSFTVELELPGIAPENVEVTAENGTLTVRGEKATGTTESGDLRWRLTERVHGSFQRSFRLPSEIDQDAIAATFANGVLTVRVPKAAVAVAKKIEVRRG